MPSTCMPLMPLHLLPSRLSLQMWSGIISKLFFVAYFVFLIGLFRRMFTDNGAAKMTGKVPPPLPVLLSQPSDEVQVPGGWASLVLGCDAPKTPPPPPPVGLLEICGARTSFIG